MNKERPVVVAMDLGEGSWVGLVHGYEAAERHGCRLIVVHVQRPARLVAPGFSQRHQRNDDEQALDHSALRFAAMDAMRRLVDRLPSRSGPDIQLEIQEGDVADELVGRVERTRARLLVVASATHDVGSTTAAIMRRASCPVLVAREGDGEGPVIAATDLSDPSMPAISAAVEIARAHDVALHVVHVIEPWVAPAVRFERMGVVVSYLVSNQVEIMAECLTRKIDRLGVNAVVHTPVGLPATEVVKLARETHGRLLIVGMVGRAGSWRFLGGSTAEDIVRRATCSVLVTRLHHRTAGTVGAAAESSSRN